MNRTIRLSLGTVVGLIVGVLGPALYAVANHTGNMSGNEPVVATVLSAQAERADAEWDVFGIRHTFEVEAASDADARANSTNQGARRAREGVAIARQYRCDDSGCVVRTWRGELSSPYAEGSYFVVDPALRYATFNGWLQNEDSGAWCRFQVNWRGQGQPASAGDQDVTTREHGARASAFQGVETAARAEAIARCWSADGVLEFGDGAGHVSQGTLADADAGENVGSQHFNRPCEPSLERC